MHPVLNFLIRIHIRMDGCWEWLGGRREYGYGRSSWGRGKVSLAHRAMWELINGDIISKQELLHSCDNTWCVNPSHLSLGTHKENMRDMMHKGRASKGIDHPCVKLTEDDVLAIRRDTRSTRRIATDYSVTSTTVSAIKRGLKWRHL